MCKIKRWLPIRHTSSERPVFCSTLGSSSSLDCCVRVIGSGNRLSRFPSFRTFWVRFILHHPAGALYIFHDAIKEYLDLIFSILYSRDMKNSENGTFIIVVITLLIFVLMLYNNNNGGGEQTQKRKTQRIENEGNLSSFFIKRMRLRFLFAFHSSKLRRLGEPSASYFLPYPFSACAPDVRSLPPHPQPTFTWKAGGDISTIQKDRIDKDVARYILVQVFGRAIHYDAHSR